MQYNLQFMYAFLLETLLFSFSWWKRAVGFKGLDCLVGLVVKASASRVEDPAFNSHLRLGDFSGSSHTSDLKIGTQVTTLPGSWRYRVSTGTGWPSISILCLDEAESLICNFYLSVTARKLVWADPSLRHASMFLGCEATNKQQQHQRLVGITVFSVSPVHCFAWERRRKKKEFREWNLICFDNMWIFFTV